MGFKCPVHGSIIENNTCTCVLEGDEICDACSDNPRGRNYYRRPVVVVGIALIAVFLSVCCYTALLYGDSGVAIFIALFCGGILAFFGFFILSGPSDSDSNNPLNKGEHYSSCSSGKKLSMMTGDLPLEKNKRKNLSFATKKYYTLDEASRKRVLKFKPKNCKNRQTCLNCKAYCAICNHNPAIIKKRRRNGYTDSFGIIHATSIFQNTLPVVHSVSPHECSFFW